MQHAAGKANEFWRDRVKILRSVRLPRKPSLWLIEMVPDNIQNRFRPKPRIFAAHRFLHE